MKRFFIAGVIIGGLFVTLTGYKAWNVHFRINLARLMQQDDRLEDAAQIFSEALQTQPDNDYLRWQTGVLLLQMGKPTQAADVLAPLMQDFSIPASADTILLSLFRSGRNGDARRFFYALDIDYPPLSREVSAQLVLNALDSRNRGEISTERLLFLLANVLEVDADKPDFELISDQLTHSGWRIDEIDHGIATAMGWQSQSCIMQETMSVSTSIPEAVIVSHLLGLNELQLTIGPDLITNGSFELSLIGKHDVPRAWRKMTLSGGQTWNRALAVTGVDCQMATQGQRSLRIDNLKIEKGAAHAPANIGFQHDPIAVVPGEPYVISFSYRTERMMDSLVSLWVSGQPDFFGERFLPPSNGEWSRVTIVIWSKDTELAPWLRLWSEGSVWFDDFSIRPLEIRHSDKRFDENVIVHVGPPSYTETFSP